MQKTAYELRISDWSSDVCSSDLLPVRADRGDVGGRGAAVGQRPKCGVGEGATDAHVEFGDRVERDARVLLAQFDQLRAQLRLPGIGAGEDRKGVVKGRSVAVRIDSGGRRNIQKKKTYRD